MALINNTRLTRYFSVFLALFLVISLFFIGSKPAKAEDCSRYSLYCAVRFVTADAVPGAANSDKCRFKLSGDAPNTRNYDIKQTSLKFTISKQTPGQPETQVTSRIINWEDQNNSSAVLTTNQGSGFYNSTVFTYYSPQVDCDTKYNYRIETLFNNTPIGTLVGSYTTNLAAAPQQNQNSTSQGGTAATGGTGGNNTSNGTDAQCEKLCETPWAGWLQPNKAISYTICQMQCALISWVASIIEYMLNNVLLKTLM